MMKPFIRVATNNTTGYRYVAIAQRDEQGRLATKSFGRADDIETWEAMLPEWTATMKKYLADEYIGLMQREIKQTPTPRRKRKAWTRPNDEPQLFESEEEVLDMMIDTFVEEPPKVIGMTYKAVGTTIDGLVTRY